MTCVRSPSVSDGNSDNVTLAGRGALAELPSLTVGLLMPLPLVILTIIFNLEILQSGTDSSL